MIRFPNVTLFAIDCFTPQKTMKAIEYSTKWCEFAEIILLTDTKKFPNLSLTPFSSDVDHPFPGQYRKMRVVHHEESDRKVTRPDAPYHPPLPIDYELAMMREPIRHVKTSHYLHIEWDSAVVNPRAWRDEWLDWDFIGALWPKHYEPGFPPCDGETNAVGNAGISLQSLRYAEAVRDAIIEFEGDPYMISSDMYPCRSIRPWLEKNYGIRFAPPDVAWKFSCENRIYTGEWTAHGRWTALENNWGGDFWGSIRPKI